LYNNHWLCYLSIIDRRLTTDRGVIRQRWITWLQVFLWLKLPDYTTERFPYSIVLSNNLPIASVVSRRFFDSARLLNQQGSNLDTVNSFPFIVIDYNTLTYPDPKWNRYPSDWQLVAVDHTDNRISLVIQGFTTIIPLTTLVSDAHLRSAADIGIHPVESISLICFFCRDLVRVRSYLQFSSKAPVVLDWGLRRALILNTIRSLSLPY